MKKLIICLLSLGMIAGCTKQDIQEEPPVVVNPSEDDEQIELTDVVSIEIIPVEYEELAESLDSRSTIETPTLLFDTEDAKAFNEHLKEISENCMSVNENGDQNRIHFLNVDCFLNSNILSIVIKYDPWVYGIGGYYSIYEVYNFSIITEKKLTNQEIISQLGLDQEKMQNQIDEISKNYMDCSEAKQNELFAQCIFTGRMNYFVDEDNKSTNINENEYFYIEDESTAGMYVFLYGAYHQFEKIKIQI